jgi:hypothetical protein
VAESQRITINAQLPHAVAVRHALREHRRRRCGWVASGLVHVVLLGALAWAALGRPVSGPTWTLGLVDAGGGEVLPALLWSEAAIGEEQSAVAMALREPKVSPPAIALAPVTPPRLTLPDTWPVTGEWKRSLIAKPPVEQVPGAEFFGIRAAGNRFVFVLDCSRNMAMGVRWEVTIQELTAAVDRLHPRQSFYVIFFDGQPHPMFDDRAPETALLPATPENVARLRQWLPHVRLGFHARPCHSMESALRLQPDAIFLLSDGGFEDRTAAMLRDQNWIRVGRSRQLRVPIHTIGLHSPRGQEMLRRIAAENSGQYQFVSEVQVANRPSDRYQLGLPE